MPGQGRTGASGAVRRLAGVPLLLLLLSSLCLVLPVGVHAQGTQQYTSVQCAPSSSETAEWVKCTAAPSYPSGDVRFCEVAVGTFYTGDCFMDPVPTGSLSFFNGSAYSSMCNADSGSCSIIWAPGGYGDQGAPWVLAAVSPGDNRTLDALKNATVTVTDSEIPLATQVGVACKDASQDGALKATCAASVTGAYPSGDVEWSSSSSTGTWNGTVGTSSPGCYAGCANSCLAPQTLSFATSCTVEYTDYQPGTMTITANYLGDGHHNAPKTAETTLVLGGSQKTGTTVSVDCVPNPVGVGSEASCDATVAGSSPTGNVTYSTTSSTGKFSPTACPLVSGGTCGVTYVDASPGAVTITANYAGDTNNAPSWGETALTVTVTSSALAVDCTPNPVPVGGVSTCTAEVSGSSPSGSVAFSSLSASGSFTPALCPLSGGTCSVEYSDTTVGTAVIMAVYGGDQHNSQSSGSTDLVVGSSGLGPTKTQISCEPNPVPSGAAGYDSDVNCAATVTGNSPTGVVDFTSDGGVFNGFYSEGYCTLNGTGTCRVTFWALSDRTIIASYQGDGRNAKSSGEVDVKLETRDPTSTLLNCTPTSFPAGSGTACYVSVSGGFIPTGVVIFSSDSPGGVFTPLTQCTLASATSSVSACHVSYVDSVSGSYTIKAVYQGDVSDLSSGNSVSISVTPSPSRGTTTTVGCNPDQVAETTQTTCTVTVRGQNSPGGIVKFSSDGGIFEGFYPYPQCTLYSGTCQVGFIGAFNGRFTVTAVYQGDNDNDPSLGRAVVEVESASPSSTIPSSIQIARSGATSIAEISPGSLQSPVVLSGTIHLFQYSSVTLSLDASNHILALSFNLAGPEGVVGTATFAIPKGDAPPDDSPVVVLDGQYAADQSYTQDSSDFYVTFSTHFSNHTASIQFVAAPAAPTQPVSWTNALAGLATLATFATALVAVVLLLLRRRSQTGPRPPPPP